MSKSDIYTLTQSKQYFIVKLAPQHSIIGNLYKSNIRTMNNFWTLSNSMIYPRKSYHSQNLDEKNPMQVDSAIPLKSYEPFSYRNESINRRIQRQNKRNYSRQPRNLSQNLKENQTFSQNLAQTTHNYYFIRTPFFNYNSFAQSGNYNLSGFDCGFLTAFSAKVAESNNTTSSLGAHFAFSYGKLGDRKDKDLIIKLLNTMFGINYKLDLIITQLNIMLGLNYKLDLIYDMYLKARGDFFYFLNQVKTLTMFEAIKPNNLGFGLSMSYGKDFDFKSGGVLELEVGLDYKALKTNEVLLNSQNYKQSLLNLIYADLGINYAKYFNTSIGLWGLNVGLGIKGNITANKLATSKIHISTFNKSIDLTLDNDKYLGYANAGISYLMQTNKFDMEFSLAYYGNFGDRVISNGGGVEFRVVF